MADGAAAADSATKGSAGRASRRLLGLIAPLGPLAMAGWVLTVPYTLAEVPAQ